MRQAPTQPTPIAPAIAARDSQRWPSAYGFPPNLLRATAATLALRDVPQAADVDLIPAAGAAPCRPTFVRANPTVTDASFSGNAPADAPDQDPPSNTAYGDVLPPWCTGGGRFFHSGANALAINPRLPEMVFQPDLLPPGSGHAFSVVIVVSAAWSTR